MVRSNFVKFGYLPLFVRNRFFRPCRTWVRCIASHKCYKRALDKNFLRGDGRCGGCLVSNERYKNLYSFNKDDQIIRYILELYKHTLGKDKSRAIISWISVRSFPVSKLITVLIVFRNFCQNS